MSPPNKKDLSTKHHQLLEENFFNELSIRISSSQKLSGGYSSATNYKVTDDQGKEYFVRFMSDKQPLGHRVSECKMASYAGSMGIGPKVYYQNPDQGLLVTEWIQGREGKFNDMVNEPNCDTITEYTKRLHKAETAGKDFPKAKSLADHIRGALKRVESPALQQALQTLKLTEPLENLFSCEANATKDTLIHGDLYPINILIEEKNNRVCFVDWTDAGIGDPFVDIASHAMFYQLKDHDKLLSRYFNDVDRFKQQKLVCYYCLRLYKVAVWGVEQAKKAFLDTDELLPGLLDRRDYSEPYHLVSDVYNGKISYSDPKNFLLVTATILNFLDKFTKTPEFSAAIEELSKTAPRPEHEVRPEFQHKTY